MTYNALQSLCMRICNSVFAIQYPGPTGQASNVKYLKFWKENYAVIQRSRTASVKKQTIKQTSSPPKKEEKKRNLNLEKRIKQPNQEAHWKMVLMKFLSCLSDLSSLFANNGYGKSSSNLHYSFNFSIHLCTLENISPSFIFFSVCCLIFSPPC